MDAIDRESEVLLPRWEWTRRGFVMTSLITGFALSVQPVSAEAIHTVATGLELVAHVAIGHVVRVGARRRRRG